jgi:hypothetical protein
MTRNIVSKLFTVFQLFIKIIYLWVTDLLNWKSNSAFVLKTENLKMIRSLVNNVNTKKLISLLDDNKII